MATQLTVDSNPFVLYRCGDCNARRWMTDGHMVAFRDVTAAIAKDSARRGGRQNPQTTRALRFGPREAAA